MVTDIRTSDIWSQLTGARDSYHALSAIQVAFNPSYNWLVIHYGTDIAGDMIIDKNIKFSVVIANNNNCINNNQYTQSGTFSGTSNYPLWIFDDNNSGNSEEKFIGRIYSYKIYDGNTLIRDYIPAYNTIDLFSQLVFYTI